jgi:putative transposase
MRERKRIRLDGFDYSSSRHYYVTICVKDRIHSFGKIENKSMQLSPNGIIALEQWHWLGNQFPYIDLISFIIMPNHVHGIIFINSEYYKNIIPGTDINNRNGDGCVGNGRDHSLHKIKPLTELIGAYKTTVSKRIHLAGDLDFKWQKSYYDHIIRDKQSLDRIKKYIETNEANWKDDIFHN